MTNPSNANTSEASVSFSDPCYPSQLVDFINETLDRKDLDAVEQWRVICEAVHYMYDCDKDAPVPFASVSAANASLETAPREFLLMIIRARRTRGYKKLMRAFGVAVWCH